jgi:hypothetical protein
MSREETQKIRNWATENGYNPSPSGRISQVIKQALHGSCGNEALR